MKINHARLSACFESRNDNNIFEPQPDFLNVYILQSELTAAKMNLVRNIFLEF